MKQAIEQGFILEVLESYTPVDSYYKLVKTIESDPEFDTKKAKKKLRRYVESHDHAIRVKAEIMVDHFHEQVIDLRKIGGEAREMVVTSVIERAIQYFHAIRNYLQERKSPRRNFIMRSVSCCENWTHVNRGPALEVKQTLTECVAMSAYDPKRSAVNRDHPPTQHPSTIANVSGTSGAQPRPAHARFQKTESDLTRSRAQRLGGTRKARAFPLGHVCY
jgi:hypothetical protein